LPALYDHFVTDILAICPVIKTIPVKVFTFTR